MKRPWRLIPLSCRRRKTGTIHFSSSGAAHDARRVICAGVAKRLEQGGFYLLGVESIEHGSWEQPPKNRFRHSESYLRAQAERAGLDFIELMECTLRRESSEPVKGFAVALRKPFLQ